MNRRTSSPTPSKFAGGAGTPSENQVKERPRRRRRDPSKNSNTAARWKFTETVPVKRTVTFNCKIPGAGLLPSNLRRNPFAFKFAGCVAGGGPTAASFSASFPWDRGRGEGARRGRQPARGRSRALALAPSNFRLNRESSRNRGETDRGDGRNWPSSLSCAVDPRLPWSFTWPDESLIFPEIYLIIARLTTSSFTSKGIECRQFPVSTLPFLRSARP